MPNYPDISPEAEKILFEIIENEHTPNHWKERFDKATHKEESILRGCFKELRENGLIKSDWADNYPFWIEILKDGYLYEEHMKEKRERSMSEFEKELQELLYRTKNIQPPINAASITTDINEYNRPSNEWINDVEIFYHKYLETHVLAKRIESILFHRQLSAYSDLISCLRSISKDKDFIAKIDRDKKQDITMSTNLAIMYDAFISHASKDKEELVEELNASLEKLGINIFYDKKALEWGDNWKQRIIEGTQKAEFAIIVISENFFDREWTERELNEFLNRQNSNGQKLILPILHNITIGQLKEKYPSVADIQGISTKDYTCDQIALLFARQLIKRLRLAHIQ